MKKKLFLLLMAILATIPNLKAENYDVTKCYAKIPGGYNKWAWGTGGSAFNSSEEATLSELQLGLTQPNEDAGYKLVIYYNNSQDNVWYSASSGNWGWDYFTVYSSTSANMFVDNRKSTDDLFDVSVKMSGPQIRVIPCIYLFKNQGNGWTYHGKLTYTSNGVYTGSVNTVDGENLFIFNTYKSLPDGAWGTTTYGANSTNKSATNGLSNDPISISRNCWKIEGAGNYQISFDLNNNRVTFTGTSTPPAPTDQGVYIRGDFTGKDWAVNSNYKFTFNADADEYYLTNVTIPAKQGFKFGGTNWDNINYGGPEKNDDGNTVISADGKYDLTYNKSNLELSTAFTGNITFKITDPTNHKAYAIFEPKEDTSEGEQMTRDKLPAHLYISTNLSGNSTNAAKWKHGTPMHRNGNTYSLIINAQNNTSVGNFVYFFDHKYESWPANRANGFGAGNSTATVTNNTSYTAVSKGSNGYFKLPEAGEWYVTFTFNNDGTPNNVKFEKQATSANGYVYFNAGADYYSWDSKDMYAYFWESVGNDWTKDNQDGEDGNKLYRENGAIKAVKMYPVSGETPLFRAAIPADPINTVKHVSFMPSSSYKNDIWKDDDGEEWYHRSGWDGKVPVYHSNRAERNIKYENGDNGSYDYDYQNGNWAKYIYGPGDHGKAFQSYLTYDQFMQLRAQRSNKKFVICGTFNGENKWTPNEPPYESDENTEDVYVFELKKANSFKISYINPKEDAKAYLTSRPNAKKDSRGWATFNLGIIGPSLNYYTPDGAFYTKATGSGNNKDVAINVDRTVEYNYWNQYNWVPSNGNLYVVVDIEYGTACLLDFEPKFTLTDLKMKSAGMEDLGSRTDEERAKIDNILVPGSDEANEAHFRFVNTLKAEATLTPAKANLEKFDVSYGIVYEGEEIGSIEDTDASHASRNITVNSIVYDPRTAESQTELLVARGLLSDKARLNEFDEPLKFRTLSEKGNLTGVAAAFDKLYSVEVVYEPHLYTYGKEEWGEDADGNSIVTKKPEYYDCLIGIEFELPMDFITNEQYKDFSEEQKASKYSLYPSFEVLVNGIPATLIQPDNKYVWEVNNDVLTRGTGGEETSYDNPQDAKSDSQTSNFVREASWVYQTISAADGYGRGYLPLNVPDICPVVDKIEDLPTEFKIEIRSTVSYPFLIKLKNNIQGTDTASGLARRRAAGSTADEAIETVDYERTDNDEKTISLSALDKIRLDKIAVAERGEGVLYTLQGVRVVDANPAAGVYIRRFEDGTARKEVVR